jgi:hypothetical protein
MPALKPLKLIAATALAVGALAPVAQAATDYVPGPAAQAPDLQPTADMIKKFNGGNVQAEAVDYPPGPGAPAG